MVEVPPNTGPSLVPDVKKAIRTEVVSQVAKWVVTFSILLVGLAASGWGFYFKERLDQYIVGKAGALPPNAVIAFDLRDTCPVGWSDFTDAAGRFILGAGKGRHLKNREFSEKKGEESVVMTTDNLPKHQHDTATAVMPGDPAGKEWGYGPSKPAIWGVKSGDLTTVRSGFAGKDNPDPIEIMPPYVALRFCKKD